MLKLLKFIKDGMKEKPIMADVNVTTDDLTPKGETTTEYSALQKTTFWAKFTAICGLAFATLSPIVAAVQSAFGSNPQNQTVASILLVLGLVLKITGTIAQTSATNAYAASRATVKANALQAVARLQAPPSASVTSRAA